MQPFRDLEPRYDPRGGSPKTPIPIPVKNLEGYIETKNDNEGVWKVIACSAITALIGMTVAYFTALRGQGVSQKDMQEYVDKDIAHDREVIATQNQSRDEKIGSLNGHKDRIFTEIDLMKQKHTGY